MSIRGSLGRRPRRGGFSLVEFLVVVGILALLGALVTPAIQHARESTRRTDCLQRMRQLAIAIDGYHAANQRFPPGRFGGKHGEGMRSTAWSWGALVAGFRDDNALVHAQVLQRPLLESQVVRQQLSGFLCPSDAWAQQGPRRDAGDLRGFLAGQANYQAVAGSNWGADSSQKLDDIGTDWLHANRLGSRDGWDDGDGIMARSDERVRRCARDVVDGLAKTLLLGENLPEKNRWCSWPYANNAYGTCAIPPNVAPRAGGNYTPIWWPNVAGFRSHHPGGVQFATADCAAHFISDAIDLAVYRSLATRAGGEGVSP